MLLFNFLLKKTTVNNTRSVFAKEYIVVMREMYGGLSIQSKND